MKYYLAIDIGASSGRHIVGCVENGGIKTCEVYRFQNGVKSVDGHLVWDVERLFNEVVTGIDIAISRYDKIESLAVDTWGVDYVLMRGEKPLLPCFAYRDGRTKDAIDAVHSVIPFASLYQKTGCQFQPFNTIYQLYADKLCGRLDDATDMLMLPEYLTFLLCGKKVREYTNATTTGLICAADGKFDKSITSALGLPDRLFSKLTIPGTIVGEYKGIKVVTCASHDTASAVEGIDMKENAPYISSGTWSLLGVKTDKPLTDENSMRTNFTNEGGVGYNRYQKNIMGMWLINRLRGELCPDTPFDEIELLAKNSDFDGIIDADSPEFLAPESMKEAFDSSLKSAPRSAGDYFGCAYRSLALCYNKAVSELEHNLNTRYDCIYIVGGGAKNRFLNELTKEATGKKIFALPIEATAIGNLKVQMKAGKEDII